MTRKHKDLLDETSDDQYGHRLDVGFTIYDEHDGPYMEENLEGFQIFTGEEPLYSDVPEERLGD